MKEKKKKKRVVLWACLAVLLFMVLLEMVGISAEQYLNFVAGFWQYSSNFSKVSFNFVAFFVNLLWEHFGCFISDDEGKAMIAGTNAATAFAYVLYFLLNVGLVNLLYILWCKFTNGEKERKFYFKGTIAILIASLLLAFYENTKREPAYDPESQASKRIMLVASILLFAVIVLIVTFFIIDIQGVIRGLLFSGGMVVLALYTHGSIVICMVALMMAYLLLALGCFTAPIWTAPTGGGGAGGGAGGGGGGGGNRSKEPSGGNYEGGRYLETASGERYWLPTGRNVTYVTRGGRPYNIIRTASGDIYLNDDGKGYEDPDKRLY